MNKTALYSECRNGFFILLGAAALASGVILFLAPNKIATGGTPGMAILLNHIAGFPIGALMVAINAPLLLAGIRYLGKSFAIRTVVAILVTSFMVDLFAEILKLEALSNNTMLATLYGGIAVGAGVGLILKGNASAGGSTIIARIVSSRTHFRPGQIILLLDLLIIISSGFVFHDIERALWSLISIYVTSKCIDTILTGAPTEKVVHIVSDKTEELSHAIIDHLGNSGTILSGTGLSKNDLKQMIFVVVEPRKIQTLRQLIQEHDPKAFMIVMEATEMAGRGH